MTDSNSPLVAAIGVNLWKRRKIREGHAIDLSDLFRSNLGGTEVEKLGPKALINLGE